MVWWLRRHPVQALAEAAGPPEVLLLDRTSLKAHRAAAGAKKAAIRSSDRPFPRGRTSKRQLATDDDGRPRCLIVGPGHRGDAPVAPVLVGDMAPALRFADAAYDGDALRRSLLARRTRPVIPNYLTGKRPHPFNRHLYKRRNLIERTICRLKDWRRIATRYDTLATNFLTAVTLAAIIIFWS